MSTDTYTQMDYAVLTMMGATDQELAEFMNEAEIAAFREWQAQQGSAEGE